MTFAIIHFKAVHSCCIQFCHDAEGNTKSRPSCNNSVRTSGSTGCTHTGLSASHPTDDERRSLPKSPLSIGDKVAVKGRAQAIQQFAEELETETEQRDPLPALSECGWCVVAYPLLALLIPLMLGTQPLDNPPARTVDEDDSSVDKSGPPREGNGGPMEVGNLARAVEKLKNPVSAETIADLKRDFKAALCIHRRYLDREGGDRTTSRQRFAPASIS